MNSQVNQTARFDVGANWKKSAWYVPMLAASMSLMMLRPLLIARILEAPEFGTYIAGLLVSSSFCVLGCLGLQPLLQRQMPMDLIRGKERSSLILILQSIAVAISLAIILSITGLSGVKVAGLNPATLAISILHGFSQQIFVLATVESRSKGEVLRFGCHNIIRAVLVVVIAVFVACYVRSPAMTLLAEAVVSFVVTSGIIYSIFRKSTNKLTLIIILAAKRTRKIRWFESLSLMIVMLVGFLLSNLDRWIAVSLLNTIQFAWYGFAWILLTASQSVQSIINSSIYPALARRFALHGRPESFRLAASASTILLLIGFVSVIPAFYLVELVIMKWFESYNASLQIIPIFMFAAIMRLSDFWSSYLIVTGKERLIIVLNILSGVLVIALWLAIFSGSNTDNYTLKQFGFLALGLTSVNYIFVFFASLKFRA